MSEAKAESKSTWLGKRITQFILDILDFIRSTPSVIFSMTLEENLVVGTTVTFWLLVLLPVILFPILLLIFALFGIRLPKLPFTP